MSEKTQSRVRPISIKQVMNGYVVEVGCQTIVVEGAVRLIQLLDEYFQDPFEVEKRWTEKWGLGAADYSGIVYQGTNTPSNGGGVFALGGGQSNNVTASERGF